MWPRWQWRGRELLVGLNLWLGLQKMGLDFLRFPGGCSVPVAGEGPHGDLRDGGGPGVGLGRGRTALPATQSLQAIRDEWLHYWMLDSSAPSHYALTILQDELRKLVRKEAPKVVALMLQLFLEADGDADGEISNQDMARCCKKCCQNSWDMPLEGAKKWLARARKTEDGTLNYFEFVSELIGRQQHDARAPTAQGLGGSRSARCCGLRMDHWDGAWAWPMRSPTGATSLWWNLALRSVSRSLLLLHEPTFAEANALLNGESGKACYNSTCSISLGGGACDYDKVFQAVAKAIRITSVAQGRMKREFHEVCEQSFGSFPRSLSLGMDHPVQTARSALGVATMRLKQLGDKLQTLDVPPCMKAMEEVLYANVDLSRFGLEVTSVLDHQLTIESCGAGELKLPKLVQHRVDLGFHHNDIVVSLLLQLQAGRPELLMVEVGTAAAEFTVHVLKALAQVQVITIDPWLNDFNKSDGPGPGRLVSALAHQALEPWGSRVTMLQMTGEDAAKLLPDAVYDLVFIDSGPHREGDVRSFLPKVQPGGILCGHDFYKTSAYTRAILASVPEGQALYLGPDWMWWFEVWLYQYDISGGLAAWAAPVAMFQSVEGIWPSP
eukprot:s201_g16.t1